MSMMDHDGSEVLDVQGVGEDLKGVGVADRSWKQPRNTAYDQDPLLASLVELSAFLGYPHSRDALIAGLPLEEEGLTPALAVRSLERAGFVASLSRRKVDEIPTPTLPCVLLLDNKEAIAITAW